MKRNIIKTTGFATLFTIISGCAMGGCVTTEQLAEVREIAEGAQAAADRAANSADAAMAAANRAMDAAAGAQSAADAANACCNENSSKLDRMFEKAMQK